MLDYHSEFYKLVVVTGGQDYKTEWTQTCYEKYYATPEKQPMKDVLNYRQNCEMHYNKFKDKYNRFANSN